MVYYTFSIKVNILCHEITLTVRVKDKNVRVAMYQAMDLVYKQFDDNCIIRSVSYEKREQCVERYS